MCVIGHILDNYPTVRWFCVKNLTGHPRDMDSTYKIGDLAREFDVTLRTLRFYEDRGLITPARAGTTRLYSEEDRERLRVALFCKRIGLSLGEIHEVLQLHDHEDSDQAVQMQIKSIYATRLKALEEHQNEVMATISDLQTKIAEMDVPVQH